MKENLDDYLKNLTISDKQSHKNLAVFPLMAVDTAELAYRLLDEALQLGEIDVTEVDEGGEVPRLKVVNRSYLPVLILDGEELVGAKQNRIVNTTILVAADSVAVIPVSCVEQGRWTYRTERFHSEKRMMTSRMRASKAVEVQHCLMSRADFDADQGNVWRNIRELAGRRKVSSRSGAMADIFDKERPAVADYRSNFCCLEGQVGAVFAISGRIVGLEAFGKAATLAGCFDKIVESYALDAIDGLEEDKTDGLTSEDAGRFIDRLLSCRLSTFPSVGLGTDCRLESDKVNGLALVVDEEILHVSAFAQQASTNGGRPRTFLNRPSRRRRRMEE